MSNNNKDDETATFKQKNLLQPRFIYGLRNDVKANTHFNSENDVIYTAAGFLVQHNFIKKQQRFLAFPETNFPCLIAINSSRTTLAILEFNEHKIRFVWYLIELVLILQSRTIN